MTDPGGSAPLPPARPQGEDDMIIAGFEDLGEIPGEGDEVRGSSKHHGEFEGAVEQVFMAMDTPCLTVKTATGRVHVFPEWDTVAVIPPIAR